MSGDGDGIGRGAIVVGTGFGGRVHVPALRAAGFEVAALVGRDRDRTGRRAERLSVPRALTSVDEALSLPGVELVTVATPPDQHEPVVRAAAAAGRHVVCEKPFALDLPGAERMVAAVREAGVVHAVGHEFRFAPVRATVARLLADGAVGAPRLATLVAHNPLLHRPDMRLPDWWFDPAHGGGWWGASGSHVVDDLRVWLGDVAAVSGALPRVLDTETGAEKAPVDDSFVVLAQLRSGATAVLVQTAADRAGTGGLTRIVGTEGSLDVDGDTVRLADAAGAREVEVPDDLTLPEVEGGRGAFAHLELGPYARLLTRVRAAIDGAPPEPGTPRFATFEDGLAGQRVLDAVRASAERGGARVELPTPTPGV